MQAVLDDRAAERDAVFLFLRSALVCRASSSAGVFARQSVIGVLVQNTSPWNSLVPDLVTAVTAALLIWSYSAL